MHFDISLPGQIYIIPVTGFFCKLCNKFYNNEKSAKGAHCQTEGHYEKFKVHFTLLTISPAGT